MRLTGIELQFFRSIGERSVVLSPLKKCNILIGKNNSGKSNIIRAVQVLPSILNPSAGDVLHDLDLHMRNSDYKMRFKLYFQTEKLDAPIFEFAGLQDYDFTFVIDAKGRPSIEDFTFARIVTTESQRKDYFERLRLGSYNIIGTDDPGRRQTILNYSRKVFDDYFRSAVRPVVLVPQFRQIIPGGGDMLSGRNLSRETC